MQTKRPLALIIAILILGGCKNSGQNTDTTTKGTPKTTTAMLPITLDAEMRVSEKDVDYTMNRWEVSGDTLLVDVQYGGGCREHDWKMYFSGAIMKSLPPQTALHLKHEVKDGPDLCRSILRETLKFDLRSLQSVASGKLVVKWSGDSERSAIYTF